MSLDQLPVGPAGDLMARGMDALGRGAWLEARQAFEEADHFDPTPEAAEMLGLAAFWLEDAAVAINCRERAFREYRARGEQAGAARVAILLADDYFTFRNQPAVANGWLQRAAGLLDGLPLAPEHGLLACQAGFLALLGAHNMETAGKQGAEAARIGHELGVIDIEMFGKALQGLALVWQGAVEAGLDQLDAAVLATTAGEVSDPSLAGAICCLLIFACEWTRDYDRAVEWCERVQAYCTQWQLNSLLGVCRAHYGAVLMARGEWDRAEEEFSGAVESLRAVRPGVAAEATVRLGELYRRRGRLDEAEQLFAESQFHPLSTIGRAAIALERHDYATARSLAERAREAARPGSAEDAEAVGILVRSCLETGDLDGARSLAASVARPAEASFTLATVLSFQARLLLAEGATGPGLVQFEESAAAFDRVRAPYEAAMVRAALAEALRLAGRDSEANAMEARVRDDLARLGRTGPPPVRGRESGPAGANGLGLTRREVEVLSLIARGFSNREIAEELVLSVRTVERHVAGIYEKVGQSGRLGRAAATAYAIRAGLA